MKMLSLQEIKQIEFEILKVFDSFCAENNIRYFLSNGTLLGAVKYAGFIPWDDDVDVLVPREDYNRLLALFEYDARYKLFAFERNPSYGFPFAKLCDMTTRKEEGGLSNGAALGLDIDIFPLDFWDSDMDQAKREVRSINNKMFGLSLSKLRKPDSVNPLKRMIKGIVMVGCKIIGSKRFIQSIIKESCKPEQKDSCYLGCKSWCIYGEREIIPAEVFHETVQVTFEGAHFPAPAGYDTYLRSLYGDYKQDPPPERQKTHHSYVAYRLS